MQENSIFAKYVYETDQTMNGSDWVPKKLSKELQEVKKIGTPTTLSLPFSQSLPSPCFISTLQASNSPNNLKNKMRKMLHPTCNSNADNGSSKSLRKGPWNAEEDAVLVGYVEKHGEGNWNAVQEVTGLARCGKSCRLRWANHLRPNLKKGPLTPEEEMLIVVLHGQFGNKWALMASLLPGRTDNEIKNYWNTRMKRQKRRAPLMASTFEYEYGNTWNYDFSEMGLSASMKMELPSTQLFNGNGGDGESAFGMLMDARNGDGHDFFEESRRFNGNINVEEEMSKLLDLTPTPSMPALPELYTTSDSRGISNGGQSSPVAAEVDEHGLGLHNLTSPLTADPSDQEMERWFVPTEQRAWGCLRASVDLR